MGFVKNFEEDDSDLEEYHRKHATLTSQEQKLLEQRNSLGGVLDMWKRKGEVSISEKMRQLRQKVDDELNVKRDNLQRQEDALRNRRQEYEYRRG